MSSKILFVANWDWVLYNFRLPLAEALQRDGLEVLLVCPAGIYTDRIQQAGFAWRPWSMRRKSMGLLQEAAALLDLTRIYREEAPDLVHHFTIKPCLYGSIAARMARVTRVLNNFTGLGFLFSDSRKAALLRLLLLPLMRVALNWRNARLVFQNRANQQVFEQVRLSAPGESVIIAGTGVDVERFSPASKTDSGEPLCLMASRLLWDKGVGEYVAAAAYLLETGYSGAFWLAGERDPGNPACIPADQIEAWKQQGHVRFLGHRLDMPALLAQADIAVLPSYHEGVPLFLLEAAAAGLPLIGTDIEGCRTIIDEGENGHVVPVKDYKVLAGAIRHVGVDGALRQRMGERSRAIAESRFDKERIIKQYRSLYQSMGIRMLADGKDPR